MIAMVTLLGLGTCGCEGRVVREKLDGIMGMVGRRKCKECVATNEPHA